MKKIGFMIDNLGPNELARQLILTSKPAIEQGTDVVFFIHNFIPTCGEPPAYFNISECFNYNGTVVATSLLFASKLLNYPGPSRKIFYVWDLEWIRHPNRNYDAFAEIYQNERLELFCRSKQHQFFIENAWNRSAKIIEDANVEEFVKCLE